MNSTKKLGIVGGGQLGLLLVKKALDFQVHVAVYDPNPDCPAAPFTSDFTKGNFSDEAAIYKFGKKCDAVIFEIEKVSVSALKRLQSEGITVMSAPNTLKWIQDKGLQRQKYEEADLPQPGFKLLSKEEVKNYAGPYPMVQKLRTGGYDGKGVFILKGPESERPSLPSVFEELADIDLEISVIVARNESGEMAVYDPTEMHFDPDLNLVDLIYSPARIAPETAERAKALAKEIAEKLDFIGLYAIELFLTKSGELLINEVAPRPHNSGHQSIEGNVCSQYEMQLRLALGLPLGDPTLHTPNVLVNLIADNSKGETNVLGMEEASKIPGAYITLYGKKQVKPYRKMGHAVILGSDLKEAAKAAKELKSILKITAA